MENPPTDAPEKHAVPMRIEISEYPENERLIAPPGYRPRHITTAATVIDDLSNAERIPVCRDYVASGSKRAQWYLIGEDNEAHIVELIEDGRCQANGPGYSHLYENAYDAFWNAETRANTFTRNTAPDFQPRGPADADTLPETGSP